MPSLIIVVNDRRCVYELFGHNKVEPSNILELSESLLSIKGTNFMTNSWQFDTRLAVKR